MNPRDNLEVGSGGLVDLVAPPPAVPLDVSTVVSAVSGVRTTAAEATDFYR